MAIYENNSKIYYVSRALRSTIELYCTDTAQISGRHSGSPLGYFIQISITTPVVSALKNCYMSSFLEVPSDILYHFWIQVADLPLKPPRGRFQK
jgi:hypothetical protein